MKNCLLFGKYALLLLFISVFALTSCKKDKTDKEEEPTKKELLSNKWKVSDVTNEGGTSVIGLPVPQIICLKDNIFTLKANDTYTIDEGAVVCDPSTAQSGTWKLTDNDTKIEFTQAAGDPLVVTLVEVNTTTLKISYELTDIPLPGTYTVTLQKQ
ncbi:DUF5004 domain-containing protein [Agriterribacter sp.]|uniref:lipocalin family protein n=1 Tax=Agriterribacter sp. TaxID=2821509 RepID=UPI002C0BCCA0|nr:DUF5004 domain-containing protein [Agriterribacter sp.]HRO48478.1 DUF5004 domain-containing protein [Agriterribacter sp.]HRQ19078.1 DUF5004 domain-containing protein [Agriterribacter sp.]